MKTSDQLLKVARAYCAAVPGMTLPLLSQRISGKSYHSLFTRIARGGGCSTESLDEALRWLDQHWPADAAWPVDVMRGPPLQVPKIEMVSSWGE